MIKLRTIVSLFAIVILAQACTSNNYEYTSTHVTKLVQEDVFQALPEWYQEIAIYKDSNEITGEYFELAAVNVQVISEGSLGDTINEHLKKEAKEIGGNGILLIEELSEENGNLFTKKIKAMAVFTLDRPALLKNQLAIKS